MRWWCESSVEWLYDTTLYSQPRIPEWTAYVDDDPELRGSGIGTSDIAQPKPWLTRAVPAHGEVAVAASGSIWHSTGWKAEAWLGRSRFLGRVAAQVDANSLYIGCGAEASLGNLEAKFLESCHCNTYNFPGDIIVEL